MTLLLRLAGLLFLTATIFLLAAAFLAAIYAIGRHNPRLLRRALLGGAAALTAYLLVLAAGPVVAGRRVLAPGSELSFCGFDCHLHVSAWPGAGDGEVVIRFRSDARAVAEHPGFLRIRGFDSRGRPHDPVAPVPDAPLAAGDTIEHTLRFVPGPGERIERIGVTRGEWENYLMPGPENPLVQARTSVALDAQSPAEGV